MIARWLLGLCSSLWMRKAQGGGAPWGRVDVTERWRGRPFIFGRGLDIIWSPVFWYLLFCVLEIK